MRTMPPGALHVIAGALLVLTFGAAPETAPAPGDDLMQPTRRALRLTPALARAMAHGWMTESPWRELELTEEQQTRVRELVARRFMETAQAHGDQIQPMLEYGIEAMVGATGPRGPSFTPESGREFGQRVGPMVPILRELLDGLPDAVGAALTPEQRTRFKEEVGHQSKMFDEVGRRLKQMADGQYQGSGNPFDDVDESNGEPKQKPAEPEGPEQKAKEMMKRAKQSAEAQVRQVGSSDWQWVLQAAEAAFGFDEAQMAKGEALLAEYTKRAEAIKTRAWRDRYYELATWLSIGWENDGLLGEPRMYRLQRAQREMLKPFDELSRSFCLELMGVATTRQRAAAVGEVRKLAEDNGMPASERPGEPMDLLSWGTEREHD